MAVLASSALAEDSDIGTGQRRVVPGTRRLSRHVADGLFTVIITGISVGGVLRLGRATDLSAVALACAGSLCLAWRRIAPMAVLVISGGAYCLYQALDFPNAALPFSQLIALYTVAARSGTVVSALVSCALVVGDVVSNVSRQHWAPANFDDELLAYVLSVGAACALGYAAQLSRARTELLREQAARLKSEHIAHEQRVLQQEQARIARELHDVVAHQVSVITALAAGADRVFLTDPPRARRALNAIEGAGREAMAEMRRLLRVLRMDDDELGVVPQPGLEQLSVLVDQIEAAGLPVRLSVRGRARPLQAGIEICAFRIVQEALTNVLKHAGPSQARVLVTYHASALELEICDNGRGMALDQAAGHGLIGMQERAILIGGELTIDAEPSGGVRINARLPVEAEQG